MVLMASFTNFNGEGAIHVEDRILDIFVATYPGNKHCTTMLDFMYSADKSAENFCM